MLGGLVVGLALAQEDFGENVDYESFNPRSSPGHQSGGGAGGEELSHLHQTYLALQQLGIVLGELYFFPINDFLFLIFLLLSHLLLPPGVIFLVAFLFVVLVVVERAWEWVEGRLSSSDLPRAQPADMVGTFKRYKN